MIRMHSQCSGCRQVQTRRRGKWGGRGAGREEGSRVGKGGVPGWGSRQGGCKGRRGQEGHSKGGKGQWTKNALHRQLFFSGKWWWWEGWEGCIHTRGEGFGYARCCWLPADTPASQRAGKRCRVTSCWLLPPPSAPALATDPARLPAQTCAPGPPCWPESQ